MPCHPPKTNANKIWSYVEYYQGDRDEEKRKSGNGLHHFTGAQSQEWYEGRMLRDTMHGLGDYRWRYVGHNHSAATYEGKFYNNRMHGYGFMSYPDGRVFSGLYFMNSRWGPGVESHACLHENVGLWYGDQLMRLAWRPAAPSVAIDLMSNPIGSHIVTPHRIVLTTNTKTIGEINSALELLKQYGAEPLAAADKWTKLYPRSCTDTTSQLCQNEAFDRIYFKNQINALTEETAVPDKNTSQSSEEFATEKQMYYTWNNNPMIIHMMKHCYTHEEQRQNAGVNLKKILVGPRSGYKEAAKHELDCRTMLMASYLGHITNVAQLINEWDVIPDITDIQGNSAMMYAACGDKPDVINFLVEAGAEVDSYNDACCTPLGITLLRYALEKSDIACSGMLQALLPPPIPGAPPPSEEKAVEWLITRESSDAAPTSSLQRSPSKINQKQLLGKRFSKEKDMAAAKRRSDTTPKVSEIQKNPEPDQYFSEEKRMYNNINNEYLIRVAEAFSVPSEVNPIPYIFEVRDMNRDVELMAEEEQKKMVEKNVKKTVSKVMKDTMKPSRDHMFQGMDKENSILDVKEQTKLEKMARIKSTILMLLSKGADPRKVRCPQPPLFIATAARCADLIRHLVKYGADLDEIYPQTFSYTAIDVAVSGPLTYDNLEVIRALLDSGADPNHRLKVTEPPPTSPLPPSTVDVPELSEEDRPTLLHAVLARRVDFEPEEEIRRQVLELLLEYGCNPITQCKGRSAVDLAMNKNMELFDIFIKSPNTDLNAVINDINQTILVKMFHLPFCKTIPLSERLQTLTNLLLFGADPLIKCRNGKEEYGNLFVYVRKVISEQEVFRKPPSPGTGAPKKSKSEVKTKKDEKPKKDAPPTKPGGPGGTSKIAGKASEGDSIGDYKQTLDLVVECARLLYIRWLQAKLMKELIEIVVKYKHRSWNMILKEHKNKKCTGLWLTAVRCLEIWDTLKTTKKRIYNDQRILKLVLCIVHFYYKRTRKILRCPSITAQEKALIEFEVANFMHEHKLATMSTPNMVSAIRPYVTPELTVKNIEKFNVCFECAMPLADAKIPCGSCNLISFCSFDCMKINIDRINCHPCSSYLKNKYFPTPEETETDAEVY